MTGTIDITRDEGVLIVSLNRPDKKNALTSAMYEAMIEGFAEADRDPAIGAILVRGSHGVFTAGNDIGDFIASAHTPSAMAAWRFVKSLADLDTPLVAAIEGLAIGIGTTMILHCDLVYASPSARFKMPFVDLGLVPEAGSSLLLPQRVGLAKASEFLLLGEAFDAMEAYRLGLVNAVVSEDELHAHAVSRAKLLASKPRAAVATTRRLLRGDKSALTARMRDEAQAFSHAMQSDDARDAFNAFMNRSPSRK